jgi:hypothetical protein
MVPETASLEATVDVGTSTPYAEVRETHSAVVFLVGDRAYKLKKPVDPASSTSPRGPPGGRCCTASSSSTAAWPRTSTSG